MCKYKGGIARTTLLHTLRSKQCVPSTLVSYYDFFFLFFEIYRVTKEQNLLTLVRWRCKGNRAPFQHQDALACDLEQVLLR